MGIINDFAKWTDRSEKAGVKFSRFFSVTFELKKKITTSTCFIMEFISKHCSQRTFEHFVSIFTFVFFSFPGSLLVSEPGVYTVSGQRTSQSSIRLQSCVLETSNYKEGARA